MTEDLERRIEELEEEVENKDIMIKALLNEIRKLKSENPTKRKKVETEQQSLETADPSQEETLSQSHRKTIREDVESHRKTVREDVESHRKTVREDVESLIHHSRTNKPFKDFFIIEDFVDYCGDTIQFSFGTSCWELKGPLKTYVEQNKLQIPRFVVKHINSCTLVQICSTLHVISGRLTCMEACVVFHDILLKIEDYSRLHFIFHALFKSKMDDSLLGSTILSIMSYQQRVDVELHKPDKALVQHITSLKYNFEIPKSSRTLETLLNEITVPVQVFTHNMVDENIYQSVFSIRLLTHYLDWDYTFNVYFNDVLYPQIEKADSYLLFLGVVNFNFFRLFGETESTEMVFEVIKSKMVGVSSTSVLSYLLIKQIDPKYANDWLTHNTQELISQGWSIEYLSIYLLF